MSSTLRVYVQLNVGSLHPLGTAEGDNEPELRACLAALLRSLSAHVDKEAAFMEAVMRYDEDDDPDPLPLPS